MRQTMGNLSRLNYCLKCGVELKDDVVQDSQGNRFCSRDCRKFYWEEIRRSNDSMISEFFYG